MTPIDRPFLWLRSCAFCYRFTLFTRVLLAAAFLPTGVVKLRGQRFTLLGPETPVGAFFEAMYQTGMYWRFLGLGQVVAAALLSFFAMTRSLVDAGFALAAVVTGFGAGLFTLGRFLWVWWRGRAAA